MKTCAISGCGKPVTKRGVTCSSECADKLRYITRHSTADEPKTVVVQETVTIEEEFRLKKEIKLLRSQLSEVLETKERDTDYEEFVARVVSASVKLTDDTWLKPNLASPKRSILVSSLSDIHAEETVDPEVMNWVNGYDLEIAEKRVRNYFENLCTVAFDNLRGIEFQGLVINLLGDMITGWIHEELAQTNGAAPMEACIKLASWLRSGIRLVANEFGNVLLPSVIGNHGRMTHKMPHKHPVTSSFDWLIYAMLQDSFSDDARVTFKVPKSIDCFYKVFGRSCCIEHGNNFRGGSNAISGVYPSIALGNYRKRNAEQAVGNPFEHLFIGDKHQLKFLGSVFMNGSVIGYNEYARDSKFGYEKPQQQFVVFDQKYGPTVKGEIFVQSDHEDWMRK